MQRSSRECTGWGVFTALCLILSLSPACGNPLTETMRQEDSRLSRRISLCAPRIYVGELLERLSEQSGVALSAGERDGSADVQIMVCWKEIPLADAMNALWSLLSYRDAVWRWQREGGPGQYRYQLQQPRAARQLAERLRKQIQNLFESHAETMLELAQMSPEERRSRREELSRSMLQEDNRIADSLLQEDRIWRGLKIFGQTLTPEQRRSVLRREAQSLRVRVSRLSEAGRAFVHSIWKAEASQAMYKTPDGRWEPVPEPEYIQIETSRHGREMAPTLFIHLERLGGYGYLGAMPLHNGLLRLFGKLWMLPGDSADDPASSRTIETELRASPIPKQRILAHRLARLSEAGSLNLAARLPFEDSRDPGDPIHQKVADYLKRLEAHPFELRYKWRSGTLLITDLSWIWDTEQTLRWEAVKHLREAEARGEGLLTMDNLAYAAAQFTPPQLQRLAKEEFPVMAHVAYWRSLFQVYGASPAAASRLMSPEGLAIRSRLASALRADLASPFLQPPLRQHLESGSIRAIRMTQEESREQGVPVRTITVGYVTKERRWVPVMGFRYAPSPR
jgi:hypothetical protein